MLYRSARAFAATARTGLGANQAVAGRRFTAIDTRGGKPKLVGYQVIYVPPRRDQALTPTTDLPLRHEG